METIIRVRDNATGITIAVRGNKPVPTGVYRVELIAIEHTDTYGGEYLKWVFRTVDGGYTIVDYTTVSASTSPTSKCVEWITALLKRELQRGEEVDWETLVGRTAIAYVRLKKLGYPERECNRIEKLLPDHPHLYPQLTRGETIVQSCNRAIP
jgi:hypothetical protein